MLWFYTRDQQSLTIETRYDNDTHEYVAIVIGGATHPLTRRFATAESFRDWLMDLERDLTSHAWTPDGPPHLLPDGWPDEKPPR